MKKFELSPLFCDGMILQCNMPFHIYGTVYENTDITVCFDTDTVTKYCKKGDFVITMPPHTPGKNFHLSVSDGINKIVLKNIYCGEVWVAGGQSNMSMPLKDTVGFKTQTEKIICDENIRFYTVGRRILDAPSKYPKGYEWAYLKDWQWEACNEKSSPEFSAIGYYFAHNLQKELKIPIGVINCNAGGSSIFNWMPREVIQSNPRLESVIRNFEFSIKDIDKSQAEKEYAQYLDSEKKNWEAALHSGNIGEEIPVVYYSELGHYTFKQPCNIYHSMYEEIIPFTVRGMIWYQGESESFSESSYLYESAMKSLLANFKNKSNQNEYAFHYVQIAPYLNDEMHDWEGICNSQREFFLHNPECGMITTGDCSGKEDIHPPIKMPIGKRLCDAALNLTYKIDEREFTGPIATGAVYKDGEITVEFSHARGMTSDTQDLKIEVEYLDRVCTHIAQIQGTQLKVKCNDNPFAIRYAWCTNYQSFIKNDSDLLASPFRIEL